MGRKKRPRWPRALVPTLAAGKRRSKRASAVILFEVDLDPSRRAEQQIQQAKLHVDESQRLFRAAKATYEAAVRERSATSTSLEGEELRLRAAQFRAAEERLSALLREAAKAVAKTW